MLIKPGETLLFTGDSVTDAGRMKPIGMGQLFNATGTGYVRVIDTVLTALVPESRISVLNTGVSGDTVLLLKKRWQTDVLDLKPDWVSILIGVNDAYSAVHSPLVKSWSVSPEVYRETLDELVCLTLSRVKGIIMMTPFVMERCRDDAARRAVEGYAAIVKEIAQKYALHCVDLQKAMDAYTCYDSASLSLDRIHPNYIGSTLIARAFLREIGVELSARETEAREGSL